MWSCSLDLLLPGLWPPHPSPVFVKRTKPSSDTWAIDSWVRVVPSFLCASLFQSVCVRVGDDVFLVATWNLFCDIYQVPHALLGAFSCRPSVSPGHLLHACRYWYCGCHPQDTAVETELIIRSRVYDQSCMVSLAICAASWLVYEILFLCSFYKKLKNVSCEYDRLNGWNSTLQAAWYNRHVRLFGFLFDSYARVLVWYVHTRRTLYESNKDAVWSRAL